MRTGPGGAIVRAEESREAGLGSQEPSRRSEARLVQAPLVAREKTATAPGENSRGCRLLIFSPLLLWRLLWEWQGVGEKKNKKKKATKQVSGSHFPPWSLLGSLPSTDAALGCVHMEIYNTYSSRRSDDIERKRNYRLAWACLFSQCFAEGLFQRQNSVG